MLSDIEIARSAKPKKIGEIARLIGYSTEEIELYGHYKAKVPCDLSAAKGKLVLVTAMNPTPFGEGKTTVSIGLADAIRLRGKNAVLALREPSLGPVFGIKGGACGGGYSQVIPMEDINLHFTGDFHAITSANNLLSAVIDNHIYQGNALDIQEVIFTRCEDMNDRALRSIEIGVGGGTNGVPRKEGFVITAASEIMAILCLATSMKNLKERLGNILVGYNSQRKPVYARDLNAQNSMAVLLKDAIKPNLVQTLEGTPALVHGGPFANIAHGCNTVIATKTALARSEYTITEAGFGAELGAEKFLDIKCRLNGFTPSCVVLVVTIRSIKYNAGLVGEEIGKPNADALKKGFANVRRHIENLKGFGQRVVVAVNRFPTDTEEEMKLVEELAAAEGVCAVPTENFSKGGRGALLLAEAVERTCENAPGAVRFTYALTDTIKDKMVAVATKIYRAGNVIFSDTAKKRLAEMENDDTLKELPVCIAKTQYAFSSDATALGAPTDFDFEVRDLQARTGVGFIVAVCGKIMLMPGLPAAPNALKIDIDANSGEIYNLS